MIRFENTWKAMQGDIHTLAINNVGLAVVAPNITERGRYRVIVCLADGSGNMTFAANLKEAKEWGVRFLLGE